MNLGSPDVYGVDCSGLVCAVAWMAGYSWAGGDYSTSSLASVSSPIGIEDVQPGDISLKPGDHVRIVVGMNRNRTSIDFIAAEGTPTSKVVILTKNIADLDGYSFRRLNP